MDTSSKAVNAHRTRLKKQGLKRVEVSVPAREAVVIRKAAAVLRGPRVDAARLRLLLGFAADNNRVTNAAELFAMPERPSPTGEALWDEAMAEIERDRKDPALNRRRKVAL